MHPNFRETARIGLICLIAISLSSSLSISNANRRELQMECPTAHPPHPQQEHPRQQQQQMQCESEFGLTSSAATGKSTIEDGPAAANTGLLAQPIQQQINCWIYDCRMDERLRQRLHAMPLTLGSGMPMPIHQ
jgi:hypothetical protein